MLALTHRSYAYENGGLPTNERLEFLGDSVLGVVVTDALYRDPPRPARGPAGQAARLRRQHARAGRGRPARSASGEQLRLGRGEEMTGGRDKSSIVADAVEAVHRRGLPAARPGHRRAQVVHRLFADLLAAAPQLGAGLDWKTSLQELSAERGLGVPEYRVTEEGPDHAKTVRGQVVLLGGVAARRRRPAGPRRKPSRQAASAAYDVAWTAGNGSPADVRHRCRAAGYQADDRGAVANLMPTVVAT